jgi:hypothetical protein
MIKIGDVISYWDMCKEESSMLQRGMNFKLHNRVSVILMSVRKGAPYADRVEDNGRVLIYEGHDVPRRDASIRPQEIDQPMHDNGKLSQNGLFYEAARKAKDGHAPSELVKVYEKVKSGVWTYNGHFRLLDAWIENDGRREIFKFRLEMVGDLRTDGLDSREEEHPRIIPTPVKIEVWKRDKGHCRLCGSQTNLHFDHIIPFSKGGSSLIADNIQLLCSRCNLAKKDHII